MGNIFGREALQSAARDVKLEVQKIKPFSGSHMEWKLWKKTTKAAFRTTQLNSVLEDADYALEHVTENELVYSHLQVAVTEGYASHLVDQQEETRDGHAVWVSLTEWYDRDTIRHETSEELRRSLDNLRLHPGMSGSDYVNKF